MDMPDEVAADNSLVVARIFEFFDGGREDELETLVSPAYLDPSTRMAGVLAIASGRETLRAAFGRDARVRVHAVVAEGDEVAVRWSLRGRQIGFFRGLPPSKAPVEISALSMFRLEDGRVVEAWVEMGTPRVLS